MISLNLARDALVELRHRHLHSYSDPDMQFDITEILEHVHDAMQRFDILDDAIAEERESR